MKHLAILLLGTTLAATPALAQTSNQIQNQNAPASAAGTQQPAATGAQQGSNTGMQQRSTSTQPRATGAQQGAAGSNVNYLTQNDPNLWRASELDGVEIYNDRDEQIGEIDEVLIDRNGSVKAVVIGVGGFLGMGQRNVAVPFERLQWQVRANDTTASGYGTAAPAGRPGMTGAQTGAATTGAAPASDAVPATGNTPARGAGAPAAGPGTARPTDMADRTGTENRDGPRRAILANATKEELENAPEFKYAD